ncbi:MAG: TorD/DmsD family molecular chaperone [Candidatus Binatia bacterium]
MIGDRELLSFRQGYYELLVSLFRKEPDDEILLRLSAGIDERIEAARNLNPRLADGWEGLRSFFNRTPPEDVSETVSDEYTRLFIGPHGAEVNPYESFYLTGRLLDRPLADIRAFLKAIGIEKLEEYPEPEDFLAFQLEVMRWLIGKQTAAVDPQDETRFLRLQADFLNDHLLVWAPACAQDIERAESAKFYQAAAKILQGFLELELNFFREGGFAKVASLDEARQRYGAVPTWKGPTFDATGAKPGVPPSEKED